MKAAVILINLALSLFTAFVLITDGAPTDPLSIALSLLLLLIPLFTAFALGRLQSHSGRHALLLPRSALLCNAFLLTISCWRVATQYPSHPKEPGLLPFVLLVVVAPLFSVVVLSRHLYLARPRPTYSS
ncbi:MAG TPA: hypothetical protein PLB02_02000 [Thermoanaerobaculia bacterium]|nr:hypothetical protein [Thermoanaerobaculia bacterium]HQR66142.1 hypothetical protein [Thermoanaerobaculia bacterium]